LLVIDARFNIIQNIFEFFEDMLLKNEKNDKATKKYGNLYENLIN